jgi:hypothetical protein
MAEGPNPADSETALEEQRRVEFAQNPGGQSTFSTVLIQSARTLLLLAAGDRSRHAYAPVAGENHVTEQTTAGILVLWAAFEAWLNETITDKGMFDRGTLDLTRLDVVARMGALAAAQGGHLEPSPDLLLLRRLRNEVVHHLPRHFPDASRPSWADELAQRGLLARPQTGDADFGWMHQLNSFALFRWAWVTTERAVASVLGSLGPAAGGARWTAQNFSTYRDVDPYQRDESAT